MPSSLIFLGLIYPIVGIGLVAGSPLPLLDVGNTFAARAIHIAVSGSMVIFRSYPVRPLLMNT